MSQTTARDAEPGGLSIDFRTETAQATGDPRRHSDADSMRRAFGLAPYDRDRYEYPSVYPNLVEHHATADGVPSGAHKRRGGTDLLVCEKPGNGKSTLLLNLCIRLLERNGEAVVWRSSQSRAEWTPLAPWTTLCLPSSCEGRVSARLDPSDPTEQPVPVALEDVAREVRYYDDPRHLNHDVLRPGQLHAVFPDPEMTDCQRLYEAADTTVDGVAFEPGDPADHWWFAYLLARLEHGPHHWTTVVLDEISNLVPEHAADDEYGTLPKIELLQKCWVDFRRKHISVFGAGHTEGEVHNILRKKVSWRAELTSNPTSAGQVVGAGTVPMETDHAAGYDFGEYLLWTEENFERRLSWSGLHDPIERELSIQLPTTEPAGGSEK